MSWLGRDLAFGVVWAEGTGNAELSGAVLWRARGWGRKWIAGAGESTLCGWLLESSKPH